MVLSASSVYSYNVSGDSYAVIKRQLLWVLIGIPCAWVASRLPYRAIRQVSWIAIGVSIVLLALNFAPLLLPVLLSLLLPHVRCSSRRSCCSRCSSRPGARPRRSERSPV